MKANPISIIVTLFILLIPGILAADISQTYSFDEPKLTKVMIGNKSYDSIIMEGLDSYANPGEPKLPFKQINILLPSGAKVTGVNVMGVDEIEIPGTYSIEIGQNPFPLLADNELQKRGFSKTSVDINPEIKRSAKFGKLYSKYSVQKLTGYNIVTLNIYPIKYNPLQGKLSYYQKITATISYYKPPTTVSAQKATTFRRLKNDADKLRRVVDNPDAASAYSSTPSFRELNRQGGIRAGNALSIIGMAVSQRLITQDTSEQYDYIIITSKEYAEATGDLTFKALTDWKASRGMKTKIVSVEDIYIQYPGNDPQEKIRNFIKDAYLNWNIQYVLLGGDADGGSVGGESGNNIVPVRLLWVQPDDAGWQSIASDVYYSNLDGNFDYNNNQVYGEPNDGENGGEVDLFAEVFVGRAPVDSAEEVANFVRKTIEYESAVASNAPWLMNNLLVGEDLYWSTASIYMNEIKDGSTKYGYETEGLPETMNTGTLYDLVSRFGDSTDYSWGKQELIDKMNNDANSAYNHLGHASTCSVMKLCNAPQEGGGYCSGSGESDIDNLQNEHPFFAYSQGCFPGAFDNWNYEGMYTTCDSAAEHFVLGTNGAFAAIMNSRYGWGEGFPSTDGPSQRHHRRFIDAIYGQRVANLGRANAIAKEGLIGYISQIPLMRGIYWETNLIGDPETAMYLPPKPEHDLKVKGIEVIGAIIQRPAVITVSIKNLGKNNETGTLLSLVVDGDQLEIQVIGIIKPDETLSFKFIYTFSRDGPANIIAWINTSVDEIPANNRASKTINVASVAFTDKDSDEAIDTNGNGLFDILRIKIGAVSLEPKLVYLEGELYADGPWGIYRFRKELIIDGEQDIDLDINGMALFASRQNGPYFIKNLKMYNDQYILQDSRDDAYTTNMYYAEDFEPARDIAVQFNWQDTRKRVVGLNTRVGLTLMNNEGTILDEPVVISLYEGMWGNYQIISTKRVLAPEPYNTKYMEFEWTPTEPGDRLLYVIANISADLNPDNNKDSYSYFSASPSKIVNKGSSAMKGYILVKVQTPDSNQGWGSWADRETIIDDIATGTRRAIPQNSEFDIAGVMPGIPAQPYDCTDSFCLQRVYVAFTSSDGKVIISSDGTAFEQVSEYYVYTKTGQPEEEIAKAFKEFRASRQIKAQQ